MSWLLDKRRAWIKWSSENVAEAIATVRVAAKEWAGFISSFAEHDKFNETVELEIRKAYDAGYDAGRGS